MVAKDCGMKDMVKFLKDMRLAAPAQYVLTLEHSGTSIWIGDHVHNYSFIQLLVICFIQKKKLLL